MSWGDLIIIFKVLQRKSHCGKNSRQQTLSAFRPQWELASGLMMITIIAIIVININITVITYLCKEPQTKCHPPQQ